MGDSENWDTFDDDLEFPDIEELENTLFPKHTEESIEPAYLECLRKNFGHDNFRPMQWKVISSIIDHKRDNCVIMATGYGKSLCYQFASVFLDTTTIVISPLISLMEDQVLSLQVMNIRACLLGTAQKDKSVVDDIFNLEYTLIYVTPEYITSSIGMNLLKKLRHRLTLVAIDEAHCISKWGHDFRPAFRQLDFIRKTLPEVPILAMTATATEQVRNDIITSLRLNNPQVLCTGFDRPNLEFNVRLKGKQGVWSDIGMFLRSIRVGSVIIYCLTRNDTTDIAKELQSHGINCDAYHAGLTINQRKKVHQKFLRDEIQVIVATIAFGMGIDKPDVRFVIHYGASKDIESYYQEIGRAGRDGMPSKCIMFHNRSDFQIHKNLREISHNSKEVQENLEALSAKMHEYINTVECRRKFLLRYFEDNKTLEIPKRSNCCDNCRSNSGKLEMSQKYEDLDENGLYDFTNDCKLLFNAIRIFKERTGLMIPILFLRGSKDKKIPQYLYSNSLYGAGKDKSDEWYKILADILEVNKYLEKKSFERNQFVKRAFTALRICLTKKATSWLDNPQGHQLKFQPSQSMYKFLKVRKSKFLLEESSNLVKRKSEFSTISKKNATTEELFTSLLKQRTLLASDLDVMPYMIASNKCLHQMATMKPVTIDEMRKANLDGFSDVKITKFGPSFIKCVLQWKNFLPPESVEDQPGQNSISEFLQMNPSSSNSSAKLTQTHFQTLELWIAGKTVKEIAQIRGLAESTISGYMNELLKNGYCHTKNDLRKLGVVDFDFDTIVSKLPSDLSQPALKDIKNLCPSTISYDMIKFVLSYVQVEEHLKKYKFPNPSILGSSSEHTARKSTVISTKFDQCHISQPEASNRISQENINYENQIDWSSDDETTLDISQIDEHIKKANASLNENLEIDNNRENMEDDDLDLLLKDIQEEDNLSTNSSIEILIEPIPYVEISEESEEENKYEFKSKTETEDKKFNNNNKRNFLAKYECSKSAKRKLPTVKITYEDSSSDGESGEVNSGISLSQSSKRRLPDWMTSNKLGKTTTPKKFKNIFS